MTGRVKRRREKTIPLDYPLACQAAIVELDTEMREAVRERGRALLAAARAGWTMRELGEALGLSAATVNRAIVAAEEDEV